MDLGHGTGKVVLSAALIHPFEQSCGIELLQSLYDVSSDVKQIYESYLAQIPASEYQEKHGWAKERAPTYLVDQGDILEEDWSDCDLIFCASLLFGAAFMKLIYEKSLKCKKGSWFITLGFRLPDSHLDCEEYPADPDMQWQVMTGLRLPMSWGKCAVWVHRKNKDPVTV